MDKFENVKCLGSWQHPEAGATVLVFYDDQSRDWYELRKGWKGGVIAVWPDRENEVGSWCPAALDYVPVEGQTLYEVYPEDLPTQTVMDLLGVYNYDGKFAKRESTSAARTKADILADLDALRAELEALKE